MFGLYIHEVEGSNPNIPLLVALNLAQYPPRYGKITKTAQKLVRKSLNYSVKPILVLIWA
jgi:hypothetical protein